MIIKRILPIALGSALIVAASVQGFAFMTASEEAPVATAQIDVAEMVDTLRVEMNTEVMPADKLAKLNVALEAIDEALDQGVQDEDALLTARDEIVDMRLDLSSEGEEHLTNCNCPQCSAAASKPALFSGNGLLGGGSLAGGGGGGIALGGGAGGLSGSTALLAAGAAAAVAIPAATSDDDAPGAAATVASN